MINCDSETAYADMQNNTQSILWLLSAQNYGTRIYNPKVTAGARLQYFCNTTYNYTNYWSLQMQQAPPLNSSGLFLDDGGMGLIVFNQPVLPPSFSVFGTTVAGGGGWGAEWFTGRSVTHPNIFDATKLDNTPRSTAQVAPNYPAEARMRGYGGEVVVGFVVNESGRVSSSYVVSTTDPLFNDAALRAVEKWRFEPGRHLGRAVSFRMTVPIVFRMN